MRCTSSIGALVHELDRLRSLVIAQDKLVGLLPRSVSISNDRAAVDGAVRFGRRVQ